MFTTVVIVRPFVREGRSLQPGDSITIAAVEAALLIRDGWALPPGAAVEVDRRPVRGRLIPPKGVLWT